MTKPQQQELQDISRDIDLMLSEMPAAEIGNLVHLLVKVTRYIAVQRDVAADQEAKQQAMVEEAWR